MAIQAQLYSDNFGMALGTAQDLFMMENACGFDFVPQQQHQQQQFVQVQRNPNFGGDHTTLPKPDINYDQNHPSSMGFYQTILEKQGLEFQQFINLQNERLRLAIQEQIKQKTALLMKKYESRAQFLLKQKEDEIGRASSRTMELQNILKRMEAENQTWQRVAKENEAMAASLNDRIQWLRGSAGGGLPSNAAEDAESCCLNGSSDEDKAALLCRCCNSRNSCVVMLPCRHLCSCKTCEAFLHSCPVCRMPKKSSIEALL